MANMKGSTYPKQKRDALIRMDARGKKKNGDNKIHGKETYKVREAWLTRIGNFLEKLEIEGKFNQVLTEEVMDLYLSEKLSGIQTNTQEKDLSQLSALFKGLRESNISVQISTNYFKEKRAEIKMYVKDSKDSTLRDRFVHNTEAYIKNLENTTAVYAKVMHQLGFRDAEARNLLKNPDNYLQNRGLKNTNKELFIVRGMKGKGGRVYIDKVISKSLMNEIKALEKIPSYATLNRRLGNHTAHDFRFTYARNQMDKYLAKGISYDKALKLVSTDLNHNRVEITKYYLQRTE